MKHAALYLALTAALPTPAAALDCARTPGLAVDADGAPNSYRVDGKGLSFTCDGVFAIVDGVVHTQKNDPAHWQALCTQHWTDAQRTGDSPRSRSSASSPPTAAPSSKPTVTPSPAQAYVTTTIPGTPDRAQRHYVDVTEIP